MPQMMSLKKLDESRWRWRAPQFVGQTQRAKKREEDDQSVGENAYLHVEPEESLADWSSPPQRLWLDLTRLRSRLAKKRESVRIRGASPAIQKPPKPIDFPQSVFTISVA